MKNFVVTSLIFFTSAAVTAAEKIRHGTYSLATETHWGASFELKANGKAVVTPWHEQDELTGKLESKKPIHGKWHRTESGIELSFAKFRDRFKLELECEGWDGHPCLRYEKAMATVPEKSPLNFEYAFINWSWKSRPKKPSVTQKCIDQCKAMSEAGQLKRGIDLKGCSREICK